MVAPATARPTAISTQHPARSPSPRCSCSWPRATSEAAFAAAAPVPLHAPPPPLCSHMVEGITNTTSEPNRPPTTLNTSCVRGRGCGRGRGRGHAQEVSASGVVDRNNATTTVSEEAPVYLESIINLSLSLYLSLSLSLSLSLGVCVCVCVCICPSLRLILLCPSLSILLSTSTRQHAHHTHTTPHCLPEPWVGTQPALRSRAPAPSSCTMSVKAPSCGALHPAPTPWARYWGYPARPVHKALLDLPMLPRTSPGPGGTGRAPPGTLTRCAPPVHHTHGTLGQHAGSTVHHPPHPSHTQWSLGSSARSAQHDPHNWHALQRSLTPGHQVVN